MNSIHLPALQVLLPLLSAPICILLRFSNPSWVFALLISWLTFFISIFLYLNVQNSQALSYAMGGWSPPWGIEYYVDFLNSYVLLIISGISALIVTYSKKSLEREIAKEKHYIFWTSYLLCVAGLLGVTITGDAFNTFVFLEISSLSTYVLIAMGSDRRALIASYRYLIMGTIGATFIVLGVGLLYALTGTLNLIDIAERIGDVSDSRTKLAALAFLLVGISLKLALFPLHAWLPNAYSYSPSVAATFLAATSTKVGIYLLIRFCFDIFNATESFENLGISHLLMFLSVVAIIYGSIAAIFENNLKKLFAYSSISQIGFITLGISLVSTTGLIASIVHIANHAITKGAVFLLLGCIVMDGQNLTIEKIKGLGKNMPLIAGGIVVSGLSLVGIPGTVGFISKWNLIFAMLDKGYWWLAIVTLFSSLITVIYVWKLVETMYFKKADEITQSIQKPPTTMVFCSLFLVFLCIYFGLNPSLPLDGAIKAAQSLAK